MKSIKLLLPVALLCAQLCDASTVKAPDVMAYFMANYKQFDDKPAQAQQWYERVIKADSPPHMYKGYLTFLYETKQFSEIIKLMPTVKQAFEDDAEIQMILARALAKAGEPEKATEAFIQLNDKFKNNAEIAFQVANIYLQRKELESALLVIDNYLNTTPRRPNNFVFLFLKSQIFVQLNNKEKALASIKESLELHPGFDKGWLMLAILREQAGDLQEAVKGYSTFLEISGRNSAIEQHLMQLMFKQKVAQSGKNTIFIRQSCAQKALTLFQHQQYDKALQHIDQCLEQDPNNKESRLMKIQILSSMNQHGKAAHALGQWIAQEPDNNLWYTTLHTLCRAGLSYDTALQALRPVAEKYRANKLAQLYCADLAYRGHNYDAALVYHKRALALTTDAKLKTKLLYHMAVISYDRHDYATMHSLLEQGASLKQAYPPLLNLLAYYYATGTKNLSRAQVLMDSVLEQEPDNVHYLDTQALIFYKQKRYKKAYALLERVAAEQPNDFTVLKHLSKTQHRMGKKSQAIATMQHARKLATNTYEQEKCTTTLRHWGCNE